MRKIYKNQSIKTANKKMKKKFSLLLSFSLLLFITGYTTTSPAIGKNIFFYGDSIYSGNSISIIHSKSGNVKKMKLADKIRSTILQKALKKIGIGMQPMNQKKVKLWVFYR